MTWTRALTSLALTAALGAAVAGCSDNDRRFSAANSGGAPAPTPAASPVPGAPTPGGPGIVAQLTGDPDNEVSPLLQQQVSQALQRAATDDPVDF